MLFFQFLCIYVWYIYNHFLYHSQLLHRINWAFVVVEDQQVMPLVLAENTYRLVASM
jgi:hypothetical protein